MITIGIDRAVPVDTVGRLVAAVATRLPSESEARWIVAQVAGIEPRELLSVFDSPVSAATVEAAHALAERRAAGEPLQYVLGSWSFRSLEVAVDARALVPRPETEQVVEVALEELRRLGGDPGRPPAAPLVVADLGTGSGVIALSLALEGVPTTADGPLGRTVPPTAPADLEVWATDASRPALELARSNLSRLAADHPVAASRVRLAEGSWFDALPVRLAGRLHLVVSNPPYVSAAEWSALDPEIRRHEPRSALVPGPTGLEALEALVDQGRRWLAPGGRLVLELAPHQGATVTAMAENAGYGAVRVHRDLAGRARTLVAGRPGA
ncbi:MAG TPA: peptide chain release factor N(5)-glutamine methyltransferase [Acidimicrobiales bacterium]|nr:peptide chain release factor N(5)-glutamine methyltransferase [Acidimicrobiales bacterium]